MPRRQLSTTSEAVTLTESIAIEEVEEATVEDYKKLNEKCDKIISKIKDRKKRKPKKK